MEQKIQGLDFTPIEKFAGKILNNLSETHREKLLKKISADINGLSRNILRRSNNLMVNPTQKRKRNHPRITLHPIKFIYDAYDTGKYRKARLVYLSTWRIYKSGKGKDSQGKYITGFDEIGEHEKKSFSGRKYFTLKMSQKKWFLPKDSRDHERYIIMSTSCQIYLVLFPEN